MKQAPKDRSTESALAVLKRLQERVEVLSKEYGTKQLPPDELEAMFRNQMRMRQSNKR
jgi:hypothetical protein